MVFYRGGDLIDMTENKVSILCSGVALGVYIPAILTDYKLRNLGAVTEVNILENLMTIDKKEKINDNKKAFHDSFRIALAGQKMARDLWPTFDAGSLEKLFRLWKDENRRLFMVFSGFWFPVLKEYMKKKGKADFRVDIVHMDAAISASWKHFSEEAKSFNNIWIFNGEKKKAVYGIPVGRNKPLPYCSRKDRYVIHGGGWGMGTYQSKIPELSENGIKMDIVVYDTREIRVHDKKNRYFMIDPAWRPWIENRDHHYEFPPFCRVGMKKKTEFKNRAEYHELFDVIRMSKAVISKPGGATLMDSLASATPLIMLEPFGDYEKKNAELWEFLGFGIPYDKWKYAGFSQKILEEQHKNLLKSRDRLIDYPSDYFERNLRGR